MAWHCHGADVIRVYVWLRVVACSRLALLVEELDAKSAQVYAEQEESSRRFVRSLTCSALVFLALTLVSLHWPCMCPIR